eukprot:293492-Pleurochrysis_carterae.AAC.2
MKSKQEKNRVCIGLKREPMAPAASRCPLLCYHWAWRGWRERSGARGCRSALRRLERSAPAFTGFGHLCTSQLRKRDCPRICQHYRVS